GRRVGVAGLADEPAETAGRAHRPPAAPTRRTTPSQRRSRRPFRTRKSDHSPKCRSAKDFLLKIGRRTNTAAAASFLMAARHPLVYKTDNRLGGQIMVRNLFGTRTKPGARRTRLSVEPLEERCLLD